jgi:cullin-associated NEDD8-dissociated protein 1
MQRFSFSNPSPRFVASCVEAFRTGNYTSGNYNFGSGEYGSLEALATSILLDREATEGAASADPSHGSIREPILKTTHLMRSMEYQTDIPRSPPLSGAPMQTTYQVRLWEIDEKIGQGPYEFPTVFSWFFPEYIPDGGPALLAQLTSPESMLATMPNQIALLDGMFSLIKYGLSDCNNGFAQNPGYSACYDNGEYTRSLGHLFYEPIGANDAEKAADLALLLTAGRLSEGSLDTIVNACATETNESSKTRCMQQLIISTPEFHSTNTVTQTGQERTTNTGAVNSTEPYKAIVYFYLGGGLDSYNMLAPHTCDFDPVDNKTVYERYRDIRGKGDTSEGVGLPLTRLLEIPANNDQPCSSFGIHENLPKLWELYNQSSAIFIANAGLMARPVTTDNYRDETPVQLFAHNAMTEEAKREDLFDEYAGTGKYKPSSRPSRSLDRKLMKLI